MIFSPTWRIKELPDGIELRVIPSAWEGIFAAAAVICWFAWRSADPFWRLHHRTWFLLLVVVALATLARVMHSYRVSASRTRLSYERRVFWWRTAGLEAQTSQVIRMVPETRGRYVGILVYLKDKRGPSWLLPALPKPIAAAMLVALWRKIPELSNSIELVAGVVHSRDA